MKRVLSLMVAALMTLSLLAGCGDSGDGSERGSSSGSSGADSNTLTTYITADISSMDPTKSSSGIDDGIFRQIYDTLYYRG